MASSPLGNNAPIRTLGRGFASMDPERQREVVGYVRPSRSRPRRRRVATASGARSRPRAWTGCVCSPTAKAATTKAAAAATAAELRFPDASQGASLAFCCLVGLRTPVAVRWACAGRALVCLPVNLPNPLSRPLAAAIVDLDGTLVDTLGDFSAALNQMLRELGQPADRQRGRRRLHRQGHGTPAARRRWRTSARRPTCTTRAWDALPRTPTARSTAAGPRSTRARPKACRRCARAGLRLACLTNKPGEFARDLLAAKGLAPCFELVFGGDAFERKKPDPLPLLKTCEALGTAPAATLMVGDSRNDAAAARAAGCPVVLVTYGYNHGEPVRAVDADGYLDSLRRSDRCCALMPARFPGGRRRRVRAAPANSSGPAKSLCYTGRVFIHRTIITGCSDRGAWPWRKPVQVRT